MRYRSKRYEIHARGCNCCQCNRICAYAPRRFDQHFWGRTTYKLYCAAHSIYRHVVKQNHIGFCFKCFLDFYKCLTLDFDFEQVGSLATGKRNSLRDATSGFDMVIFDEHAITEIETVILSSTQSNRFFFQAAQSGRGLACIENTRLCSFERTDTLRREGSNAREVFL